MLILAFVGVMATSWFRPSLTKLLIENRKLATKEQVNTVWSIIKAYHQQAQRGEITEKEAQKLAIDRVNQIRYGPEMKDYFWIHDQTAQIVAHPYSKTINLSGYEDQEGTRVVVEMNQIVEDKGEGFLEYYWQWKDDPNRQEPKVSFVKGFAPWGWIIGSGFYLKDSQKNVVDLASTFLNRMGIAAVILVLLLITVLVRNLQTIQDLRESERHARGNEKRFLDMADRISYGCVILKDNRIVFENRQAMQIVEDCCFESPPRNTSGNENIAALYERVRNVHPLTDEASKSNPIGIWIPTRKGDKKYIKSRLTYNPDTEEIYLIFVDETELNRSAEEIERLSRIIEVCPLSIVITDLEGKIEYANAYAATATGYQLEEILGQKASIFKSNRVPTCVFKDLWETITSGHVWRGEILNHTKDGKAMWEYTVISPLRDARGRTINYFAVKTDITENKKLESDLRNATKKAEESSRLKSAFLENISHEIRTPLNAIHGFLQLFDVDTSKEYQKEYLKHMEENTHTLLHLVDDLLSVSEMESSLVEPDYAHWNLDEIIEQVIEKCVNDPYSSLSQEVLIETSFEDWSYDPVVYTDLQKIQVVLEELLTNAIKYTQEGVIRIGYSTKDGENLVFVEDTGPGISETDQPHVFELFYHGRSTYVSLHRGTGVGLNRAKMHVDAMGGRIWFESRENEGTTFYVSGIYQTDNTHTNFAI